MGDDLSKKRFLFYIYFQSFVWTGSVPIIAGIIPIYYVLRRSPFFPDLFYRRIYDCLYSYLLEEQGVEGEVHWLKLQPKDKDSTFKYLLIGLAHGELTGMELSDNFGSLTRIYFSNLKHNINIDPQLFEFKTPKGADVFSE